ncbi:MAG: glycosyltransferase family 4 protein [Methanobacteriota archaeon]
MSDKTFSRPRILHLITRWMRGGAEEKTFEEIRGLRDRYAFHLAHGAASEPEMVEALSAIGVPRTRIATLRHYDPVTAPLAVAAVRRLLRRERTQILHVHSTEAGVVGRLAARGTGIPVVYTLHGMPFGAGRAWPLRAMVLGLERRLASATTRFVANATAIRDAYLAAGIGRPEQYAIVPSGIDLESVRAAAPAALPGKRPRVVYAGRLVEGKGILELVESVRRLRSDGIAAELLVAGEGPLASAIDERAGPWLHRLGYRDDLPAVIKACDLLALPSELEGTPRSITAAMAAGVPVVATRVGGIPDQIGDDEAGLLVPAGDGRALAEALRRALSDADLRRELGAAGAKRAELFSREAMIEATDDVYRAILQKGG